MGTHKSSSAGKSAKGNQKHSAKESSKEKDKHSKPASKFSSIKQALFGGGAAKKNSAPAHAAKPAKKEAHKGASHKPAKASGKEHAAAAHPAKKEAAHHAHPAKKSGSGAEAPKAPVNHKKSAGEGRPALSVAKGGSRAAVVDTGEAVCREVACEGLATSAGYCRLHYIKNWKKIKRKEVILKEGKLNQYIEELVAKYPDKYIEAIRQDLANDKDFAKVIYDLDLDESLDDFDVDAEASDTIIDSIKRDFDDEGDTGF